VQTLPEPSTKAHAAIKALDKLYEYEREPVPSHKLQPLRHFAALFAGEHIAGTEFVIGATFVAWGVRTYDVIVGLILGNLMAVLTWTLVCTPIAVQTRLTLYWYLRKIAGPVTTMVYNILNAVLFSVLAGFMITVSASSVRMLFGIPAQTKWYPEDFRFVILVLVLGAVVVTLAILGFKKLAQFAEVCAAWMFVMFVAGGLVMLPGLAAKSGFGSVKNWSDLWHLADKTIWTGVASGGGQSMSFWQVAAFAWVCNLATHAGLSDMALFRYARRVSYGLTSAIGMLFGHYIAWICAGIMGAGTALALNTTMDKLDAGAIAMQSLGIAGAITVVLAGWTTANPTMYRAGLAFQAVTPGWPRWAVTMAAGILTTVIACFPFVFSKVLNFAGWYGLLLLPAGTIVFVEHWIFPRIGLTRYWASHKGLAVSWPALGSWAIAIVVAVALYATETLHRIFPSGRPEGDLFFLFIPTWLLTAGLYTLFALMAGASEKCHERAAEEPSLSADDPSPKPGSMETEGQRSGGGNVMVLWVSGIIAAASLLVCAVLPVWVFVMGTKGYDQRLANFKIVLLWASLLHLSSATVWAIRKDKRKGGF
jgi:cytosine permease